MILKMNRKSKGKSGVVEYLLNEREVQGTAQTLRGNPELTKSLIKHVNRKHKYLSGGLMFSKEERLSEAQQQEIMDSFEALLFTGLDENQYHVLWVRHTDKDRLELNFVVPRMELNTGIDLDLYSHKRDMPLFDMWKNGINKKYGLADPNDPERARTKSEQNKQAPFSGSIIANREKLDETLHELVNRGEIKSRSHMLELLELSGYQIARKGSDYISVQHADIGKKSLRLKGGIYSENFTSPGSIESISETRKPRATQQPIPATQRRTGEDSSTYRRYLQTRTDRHKKRYPRAKWINKEKPQQFEKRDADILDSKNHTKNERSITNDGIRQALRTNLQEWDRQYKSYKERERRIFDQARESHIRLSTIHREAEQQLLERVTTTRECLEKGHTEYAEQIYRNVERADTANRTNATKIYALFGRVAEQFSRLAKSIEGVIHAVKKKKIFQSAKEDMLSQRRPTISLTPRR